MFKIITEGPVEDSAKLIQPEKNEWENIQRNILVDSHNNWFDLFFDLTKHLYLKADVEWFSLIEEARRCAEELYQRN